MNLDQSSRLSRLDAALDRLTVTFRGMTARSDERNCECHWGSAAELALLKVPDVELDPDLLRRSWQPSDWLDHALVLRRILPQLANALVNGQAETHTGLDEVGRSMARGKWQQWPVQQAATVQEFLESWWIHSLTDPNPIAPVYQVLALCAEASGVLRPWLDSWGSVTHPAADRHLIEAVARWTADLLDDQLPWDTADSMHEEQATCAELSAWILANAAPRLRAHGAPEELLRRVQLLGLSGPSKLRWKITVE